MSVVRITDPADPRVHDYTNLTDAALRRRREPVEGLYIAESPTVVRRALAAGHRPRSFFLADAWLDDLGDVLDAHPEAPAYVGAPAVLEAITGFHLHRGALAAMHRPEPVPVDRLLAGARRVAVAEDIVDHTNLGAVFRSAAALDVDAVLLSPRCADPLYRRSVRVSMGTVFQVPWARLTAWPDGLASLKDAGFATAALALDDRAQDLDVAVVDGTPLPQLDRLALVLGTEGAGLSTDAIAACDAVVRIPMSGGVDSLNVAAAAAVAFWHTRPMR
ncbi:RNA methyltransferase [Tersicoccus sp. Bi-70]|uniref:TrmH family RNA methyltransferase n=1 Tax=Tersicoccus sp. Bi-70 TaxID=1897634 RepID=UPI0009789425|nr:RNA methyltransferase [Tersicoccus sp. Bi-70]OMH33041.1 rRNA methyltransferase [Tersicoccus sp. Bi-70]